MNSPESFHLYLDRAAHNTSHNFLSGSLQVNRFLRVERTKILLPGQRKGQITCSGIHKNINLFRFSFRSKVLNVYGGYYSSHVLFLNGLTGRDPAAARCQNCDFTRLKTLSLWERVAVGRVRVPSYATALNSPRPNPLLNRPVFFGD